MKPNDLSIDNIKIGDTASFLRTWNEDDIKNFANLSGDENPLHMDEAYAETTSFKQRLVHGMLLGSLFSTLVGMYLPGKRCLYLDQSLSFKKPVFIGDIVEATATVIAKSEVTGILALSMVIKKDKEVVVEGEAHVKVL